MMETIYQIALILMIAYVSLTLYFEHREEKRNKEYQKKINNGK